MTRSILCAALAIACLIAAGCYRHVIRETGPERSEKIYEPNAPQDTGLESLGIGKEETRKR